MELQSRVKQLMSSLLDSKGELHTSTIEALKNLGNNAVDPLIAMLSDQNDSYIREVAAEALGEINDQRAIQPLIGTLSDPVSDVREKVIWALGNMAVTEAVPSLISTLGMGEDPEVQEMAVWALIQIGSSSTEFLLEAVQDSDILRRINALDVLTRQGNPKAFEIAVQSLRDDNPFVRANAIRNLSEIGDPAATESIRNMLEDPEALVVEKAQSALEHLSTVTDKSEANGIHTVAQEEEETDQEDTDPE